MASNIKLIIFRKLWQLNKMLEVWRVLWWLDMFIYDHRPFINSLVNWFWSNWIVSLLMFWRPYLADLAYWFKRIRFRESWDFLRRTFKKHLFNKLVKRHIKQNKPNSNSRWWQQHKNLRNRFRLTFLKNRK
jgi:hypothetical protein